MSNPTMIEQRFEAIERALDDLRRRIDAGPSSPDWLDLLTGSVSDEDAFREALGHGRALRLADRPPADPGESR